MEYITSQGETLDEICYNHYGKVDDYILGLVYSANQNIGDYGLVFPVGVKINLPII